MIHEINLRLTPQVAFEGNLLNVISENLNVDKKQITDFEIIKRSVDARKKDVLINMRIKVFIDEPNNTEAFKPKFNNVSSGKRVVVVGAGPAGLFAAMQLIESGLKPIVLERGKDVSERKKDIAQINTMQIVNPDSNYCFGEGGAGTFSDGKLYTRSTKRGNVNGVLQNLVFHGANKDILIDAHPHIGSDKLPEIITNIRKTIIDNGGEVVFNAKVTDVIIENSKIIGVVVNNTENVYADAVILATGHSASDIFELLHSKNIAIESKPFAMGVRVEHPQSLIDKIQYKTWQKDPLLPAAEYSLVEQINGRGVFTFCMCPGGIVVPSTTSADSIIVNGMSNSKRNSPYANSGIVVEIQQKDLKDPSPLCGLKLQQELEQIAKINGGGNQIAPAQCLSDFVSGKYSTNLPKTSYHPGVISSPMHSWLPQNIGATLQAAFKLFNKKMHGFITNEALIIGVESRTSSPVRIPRNAETLQHTEIQNLYPCGEGAGYAGGIVSSALDGIRCAQAASQVL